MTSQLTLPQGPFQVKKNRMTMEIVICTRRHRRPRQSCPLLNAASSARPFHNQRYDPELYFPFHALPIAVCFHHFRRLFDSQWRGRCWRHMFLKPMNDPLVDHEILLTIIRSAPPSHDACWPKPSIQSCIWTGDSSLEWWDNSHEWQR